MRFEYPYKYYRGGYFFFIFTEGYGLYILYTSSLRLRWQLVFFAVFTILFFAVRSFYLQRIRFLKSYAITVDPGGIEGLFRGRPYRYEKHQIRSIYYTREVVRFKLFHVIHIFTLEGDHLFFSDEILKFKQLKRLLLKSYPHLSYQVEHLLTDSTDPEEEKLYLAYLRNQD